MYKITHPLPYQPFSTGRIFTSLEKERESERAKHWTQTCVSTLLHENLEESVTIACLTEVSPSKNILCILFKACLICKFKTQVTANTWWWSLSITYSNTFLSSFTTDDHICIYCSWTCPFGTGQNTYLYTGTFLIHFSDVHIVTWGLHCYCRLLNYKTESKTSFPQSLCLLILLYMKKKIA